MSDQKITYLRPNKIEEVMATRHELIQFAKNLAWELKTDTPLFETADTLDRYWRSLTADQQLKYVAAVEMLLKGLLLEIDREKALFNNTRLWLEKFLV